MTKQEFDTTGISANTKVIISNEAYKIHSVDYESGLIEVEFNERIYQIHYAFCRFQND